MTYHFANKELHWTLNTHASLIIEIVNFILHIDDNRPIIYWLLCGLYRFTIYELDI